MARRQVAGVDDLFNEKMRVVVEYMQYRGLSSDIKRKVGEVLEESRTHSANLYRTSAQQS